MKLAFIKRESDIEKQIQDFTDKIREGGMFCKNAMEAYLKKNHDAFAASLICIRDTERCGDGLRRSILEGLHRRTLIPESRGDVMELLDDMDELLNRYKELISQLEIEQPDIAAEFHQEFRDLLECSLKAVDADVQSCKAFFSDVYSVADHIRKVSLWEKETDKISKRLQRAIFSRRDLELSQKIQLHFFAAQIDRIADDAEDIADRLNIYVSKRML